MNIIGFDIGKSNSQVCILDENGAVVLERRLKTTREAIHAFFAGRGGTVLVEAGTSTEWIAQKLETLGLAVHVADPASVPMSSLGTRKSKTDKRDALALALALKAGLFRPAYRRPEAERDDVNLLRTRDLLVGQRTAVINNVKAVLEQDGHRPPRSSAATVANAIREMPFDDGYLRRRGIDALLDVHDDLTAKIKDLSARIEERAQKKTKATALMSVPCVGPITALAFSSVIGDARRFKNAKQVYSYLGLAPRERSSGEGKHLGRITKAGDPTLRKLLIQVAHLVRRSRREELRPLVEWSCDVELRRGAGRAVVALARKLAGILWALMRDDVVFDASHFARKEG